MGLLQSERSSALHDASDHTELQVYDLEGGRRAEPMLVQSTDGSLLSFAPEEELDAFPVIEQYEPSAPPDGELIDSARPLSRWRSATLAGVVLLAGVSTGLLLGTRVLPEPRTTLIQVDRESIAEARSFPTTRPFASAPARLPDPAGARSQPPSEPVPRVASDSKRGLELDELRRAFASLDTKGIPFEQCAVRVPALDRVVIRCQTRRGEGDLEGDGSPGPPAEWIMDFNRALNRWQVVSAPAL